MTRRLPAPWTVEEIAGGFRVVDANGLAVVYVYGSDHPASAAEKLTLDEARRVAANVAKLPGLVQKGTRGLVGRPRRAAEAQNGDQ
jgi:hypothetical protein